MIDVPNLVCVLQGINVMGKIEGFATAHGFSFGVHTSNMLLRAGRVESGVESRLMNDRQGKSAVRTRIVELDVTSHKGVLRFALMGK